MTDERSLAAQAAGWVPPWERAVPDAAADALAHGDAGAVDTVPVDTDAVATVPVDAVRVDTDAVATVPVDAVRVDTDAVATDPVDTDAVATVPVDTAAVATVLVDTDAVDAVPVDTELRDTDPVDTGPADVDAGGAYPGAPTPSDISGMPDEDLDDNAGDDSDDTAAAAAAPAIPRQDQGRHAVPEPAEDDGPDPLADDDELCAALEAILMVVDEPVVEAVLADVLRQPVERIVAALEALATSYTEEGRGFELRRAAGGWRFYTRGAYAPWVERFVLDGQQVRLTQAALETLAVVAYKQPVTRGRISAIRGVNCDGVLRTLTNRGLIEECGAEPESGAYLYRTTTLFLEKLGLDAVTELPPLAPFLPDDIEEIADADR